MQSNLLTKYGVINHITGMENNLRYETAGDGLKGNVEKALEKMAIHPKEIYSGQQCHGRQVAYADGKQGEDFVYGKVFSETDGLITDKPDIALLVKFADCTPVVLYDPVEKVLAAVHSGWRGTMQQISKAALDQMVEDYGSQVENVVAYLGPSIDQANYEVGPEVYEAFEAFENRDNFFKPKSEKYHLSMTDANLDILKRAGIKEENIEVERESTFESERLHSSRQEGKDYQLNSMIVMMP